MTQLAAAEPGRHETQTPVPDGQPIDAVTAINDAWGQEQSILGDGRQGAESDGDGRGRLRAEDVAGIDVAGVAAITRNGVGTVVQAVVVFSHRDDALAWISAYWKHAGLGQRDFNAVDHQLDRVRPSRRVGQIPDGQGIDNCHHNKHLADVEGKDPDEHAPGFTGGV